MGINTPLAGPVSESNQSGDPNDCPEGEDSGAEVSGAEGSSAAPGWKTVSARLERLFATVLPPSPDGRTYSNADVAARATEAGYPISESYVYQLRRDPDRNPTMRALQALAAAFGVPVRYFVDDTFAEQIDADLPVLAALRDPAVRELALVAAGLSATTVQALTRLAVLARRAEGLSLTEEP